MQKKHNININIAFLGFHSYNIKCTQNQTLVLKWLL